MRSVFRFPFVFALFAAFNATAALAGEYRVTAPVVHGNLAIYPVEGAATGAPAPLTLDRAMKQGLARVFESVGGGHTIDNLSGRTVFIQAGDLVLGGSQDQVAASDVLVPPLAKGFALPLFCVERDRSSAPAGPSKDAFSPAGLIPSQTARLSLATGTSASPTADLLRRINIWLSVESLTDALTRTTGANVRSTVSPSSLPRALDDSSIRRAQQPYMDALSGLKDNLPHAIGAVFAINGKIYSAEVYASTELFREMWPKLLRAYAIEAAAVPHTNAEAWPDTVHATSFLADAESDPNARYAVTVHHGGEWVHKNYLARVDGTATDLEATVLRALETKWSVPLPTPDVLAVSPRRYQEAVLLQALTGLAADRERAIAQAKRAGLPVDPEQLRASATRLWSLDQNSNSTTEYVPWLLLILTVIAFPLSHMKQRRRSMRARQAAHARPTGAQSSRARIASQLSEQWARTVFAPTGVSERLIAGAEPAASRRSDGSNAPVALKRKVPVLEPA